MDAGRECLRGRVVGRMDAEGVSRAGGLEGPVGSVESDMMKDAPTCAKVHSPLVLQ